MFPGSFYLRQISILFKMAEEIEVGLKIQNPLKHSEVCNAWLIEEKVTKLACHLQLSIDFLQQGKILAAG